MSVYLLHFDRPYPAGKRPQHYIGWAQNVGARVAHHAAGTSRARLPEVMHAAGIGFTVARVWDGGDKTLERRLKNWNKARVLCPACKRGDQLPLFPTTHPTEGARVEPPTAPYPLTTWRIAA